MVLDQLLQGTKELLFPLLEPITGHIGNVHCQKHSVGFLERKSFTKICDRIREEGEFHTVANFNRA